MNSPKKISNPIINDFNALRELLKDDNSEENSILDLYEPIQILGTGSFSTVVQCTQILAQKQVAIKVTNTKYHQIKDCRQKSNKENLLKYNSEGIVISQAIKPSKYCSTHRRIQFIFSSLSQSKESSNKFYIILELVQGEPLSQFIKTHKKENTNIPEEQIKSIISQILHGLEYVHRKKIIHRDLKPENILIKIDQNEQLKLKIIDFGLSFQNSDQVLANKPECGTLLYMAPEVIFKDEYNQKVDMWSLGIILYNLYAPGMHPVWDQYSDNKKSFLKKLNHYDPLDVIFPENMPKQVKMLQQDFSEAINFFFKTVSKQPEERMNSSQALRHIWLNSKEKKIVPVTMNELIDNIERIKKVEQMKSNDIFQNGDNQNNFENLVIRLTQKQQELEQLQDYAVNFTKTRKRLEGSCQSQHEYTEPNTQKANTIIKTKKISDTFYKNDKPQLFQFQEEQEDQNCYQSIRKRKYNHHPTYKKEDSSDIKPQQSTLYPMKQQKSFKIDTKKYNSQSKDKLNSQRNESQGHTVKSIIQKLNESKNRKYGQIKKKIITSLNLNYPSIMNGSELICQDNDSNNSSPIKDGGNFDQLRTQFPEFEIKSQGHLKVQSQKNIECKTSLSPVDRNSNKLPQLFVYLIIQYQTIKEIEIFQLGNVKNTQKVEN